MVDALIERELAAELSRLPVEQQRKVLEYARTLAAPQNRGVQGVSLLCFAGSIDEADVELMSRAIEEGCERIDESEW